MTTRKAEAQWEGTIREGHGVMELQSGSYKGPFTFASRFESGNGTNPEELIGAAHAGCYSMALSGGLTRAGFTPTKIVTTATVHLNTVDGKPTVNKIDLACEADVPGIEDEQFQQIAAATKVDCPISRLLGAAAEITLEAKLV